MAGACSRLAAWANMAARPQCSAAASSALALDDRCQRAQLASSRLGQRARRAGAALSMLAQQRAAVRGADRLGVELHAVHGVMAVLHAHHRAVRRPRRDAPARRAGVARSTTSEW